MTDVLRVLATDTALRENGGLRQTLDYLARWSAAGVVPTFAAVHELGPEDNAPRAQPAAGIDVRYLIPAGRRFRYGAPAGLVRLVRLARRADVVLSGTESGVPLLLAGIATRLAGRPLVVFCQAELEASLEMWVPRPLHGLNRWTISKATAAICVADSVVPGVAATGLAPDRIHVVRNGVDATGVRARAGGRPRPQPEADGRPTMIASGRLQGQKDFPTLLRAHASARAAGADHRLVVLGEGPDRNALVALAQELGVADSVEFAGFDPEPFPRIAGADLFVLSSRMEGTPLVLLEALALGVPVISTRCGSGPDVLLDGGRYGRLVDVGDVRGLAEAIAEHFADPGPLRSAADAAPEWVRTFDVDAAATAALAVLRGAAG